MCLAERYITDSGLDQELNHISSFVGRNDCPRTRRNPSHGSGSATSLSRGAEEIRTPDPLDCQSTKPHPESSRSVTRCRGKPCAHWVLIPLCPNTCGCAMPGSGADRHRIGTVRMDIQRVTLIRPGDNSLVMTPISLRSRL